MSDYQTMPPSIDVTCPYCLRVFTPEKSEIPSSGEIHECEFCHSKYYLDLDEGWYIATPDCKLNGKEHKFSLEPNGPCIVCGSINDF